MDEFVRTLVGREVYVKLARDWSVQGRLATIEENGLVVERPGIPPILINRRQIGTIEEVHDTGGDREGPRSA